MEEARMGTWSLVDGSRASRRLGTAPMWLGLLVMGATACREAKPLHEPQPATGPAKVVEVAVVERSEAELVTTVAATVRARQRAALSARIPASVTELPFREGQSVSAGATVVRLDDAALRSALAAAEATQGAAETDLGRMEALLERNAATPRELDQARTQAAGARAGLSLARENLAYAVLRAPFAGTIAARPVHVGDVVSPGETLIEIEGRDGLQVEATVGSELVASLRPGVELQVHVDGHEQPLTARVRSVSPAGDPATHRFGVEADLPETPGLRSGLFARLALPSRSESPRITVASQALFRRGGLTGVFVIAEGKAQLRWVAPGAETETRTEIRAGLHAGERVALDPAGLSDGAPVRESR